MAMQNKGTVLIVEDDLGVATLERRRLEREGYSVAVAGTAAAAMVQVRAGGVTLILLDYRLPGDVDGLDFCTGLREAGFDIPVILVTGFSTEATVIKALRANVRDYVTKSVDYLDYLPGAVQRVLKQVGIEQQLAESEARLAAIIGSARDAILTVENDRRVSLFNPAAERMFGCSVAQALGKPIDRFIPQGLPDNLVSDLHGVRACGQAFPIEVSVATTELPDRLFFTVLVRDITERKHAEEVLRKNQEYLRTIIDNEPECVMLVAADGSLLEMNAAGLGMNEAETLGAIVGKSVYSLIAPEYREAYQALNTSVCQGQHGTLEFEIIGLRGTHRWMQTHAVPFRKEPGGPLVQLAITRDITERKRLESQFHQSQKMEAIGRLAGGVAHDFNNLLTVIIGYSELLLDSLSTSSPEHQLLAEIRKASDRAAGLTRQLLAFGRKQMLDAKVLDLNELLAGDQQMLQRLIGEDVQVRCDLAPDPWSIVADPGQLHQVIMNLAVNARDAMPQGGELIFKTANVELGHTHVWQHPEVLPGPYVMLSVTDTGCGMDKETLALIFEPFFTTKRCDKGTGLGLAVVYGIVKQSGGYLHASSTLKEGTTITIYLPRFQGQESQRESPAPRSAQTCGSETILVVEDEDGVRNLTTRMLRECGYNVLEARNGIEGMQKATARGVPICLLVSDVILPGMSGKQLADQLAAHSPNLKVLFVSGYTADIIAPHGVLEPGTAFLQKPFSPAALARKVRQVLDGLGRDDDTSPM